ncbi:hypothetical protein L210DRAFT_2003180 [Boletus edulis BED1]|uniref:Uncharacterized protein n=1 Tax=Boletus edulis BED1 TaxID=1328754 RepID=A0AAD4C969_BOLED|nr:hypothetical protein L210DRAFT_2003180 [Boletus edulis BED1]
MHKGYQTCDIAFEHFHSSHLGFLLLTKAIIVFMAREHPNAISSLQSVPTPCAIQESGVHVFFFLETHRWNVMTTRVQCIRSRARAQFPNAGRCWASPFCNLTNIRMGVDDLDILIRQRLCEALYPLGRTMELLWTKKSTSGFLVSSVLFHSFPAHSGCCLQTLPNNVSRASKTLVSQLRTHSSMVIRRCSTLISIYRPPFHS